MQSLVIGSNIQKNGLPFKPKRTLLLREAFQIKKWQHFEPGGNDHPPPSLGPGPKFCHFLIRKGPTNTVLHFANANDKLQQVIIYYYTHVFGPAIVHKLPIRHNSLY